MDDERRLRQLLPASTLQRRRVVNSVNMKTTFICWLVEFIGSLLFIVGPFITGHNNVGWGVVQVLIMFVYFIMLPFTYFIIAQRLKISLPTPLGCMDFSEYSKQLAEHEFVLLLINTIA